MPRPQRCRRVCNEPEYSCFEPEGINDPKMVVLSVDEYEVIRLVDYNSQSHEQCALIMDISRTTVTEIYERARFKISDCIVNGKRLVIAGGNYRICSRKHATCNDKLCPRYKERIVVKGIENMKVAVTYENGEVFQHFGHCSQFKIYEVVNGEIINDEVVDVVGQGHGALAVFLADLSVNTLICGGIGQGAKVALESANISLYPGVNGNCDEAVKALINGTLGYSEEVSCDHHESNCGNHCH